MYLIIIVSYSYWFATLQECLQLSMVWSLFLWMWFHMWLSTQLFLDGLHNIIVGLAVSQLLGCDHTHPIILQTCLYCTCICACLSVHNFHMQVFTVKMPTQSHHCPGFLTQIGGNNHKQPPKYCKLLSCAAPVPDLVKTNHQLVFDNISFGFLI